MRENRPYGSEGGGTESNRSCLPLSVARLSESSRARRNHGSESRATVARLSESSRARRNHGSESRASAPAKALVQQGASPCQADVTACNTEGNCVPARGGGEQPEENDQSVTQVNSIRPRPIGEAARNVRTPDRATVIPSTLWVCPGDRRGSPHQRSSVGRNAGNGDAVVGDGMVGSASETSRENCRTKGRGRRLATKGGAVITVRQ